MEGKESPLRQQPRRAALDSVFLSEGVSTLAVVVVVVASGGATKGSTARRLLCPLCRRPTHRGADPPSKAALHPWQKSRSTCTTYPTAWRV